MSQSEYYIQPYEHKKQSLEATTATAVQRQKKEIVERFNAASLTELPGGGRVELILPHSVHIYKAVEELKPLFRDNGWDIRRVANSKPVLGLKSMSGIVQPVFDTMEITIYPIEKGVN